MIDAFTVTPQFVLAHILYNFIKESPQFPLVLWKRPLHLERIGCPKRRKSCGNFQSLHQRPDFPVFLYFAFLFQFPFRISSYSLESG